MASANNFVISMTNYYNDLKREIINDIGKKIQAKDNWTSDELHNEIMNEMLIAIKANKKVKKVSKPRFSGYHECMQAMRLKLKEEQPNLTPQEVTKQVSKVWGTLSDNEKEKYNVIAANKKEEYYKINSNSEKEQEVEDKPKMKKEVKEEKPAKKKKEEKEKKTKKNKEVKKVKKNIKKVKKSPSPPSEIDDSDIPQIEEVEEAESDIDI